MGLVEELVEGGEERLEIGGGVGGVGGVGTDVGVVDEATGFGEVLVVGEEVVAGEELEDAAGGGSEEEVGEGGAVGGDDEFGLGEEGGLFADGEAGEGVGFEVVWGEVGEDGVFVEDAAAPGIVAADVEAAGGFGRSDVEEGAEEGEVGGGDFAEGFGGEGGESAAAVVAIDAGFEPAGFGDVEGTEGFLMEGGGEGGVEEVEGGGVEVAEAGQGVDDPVEVVFPGAGGDDGENVGVEVDGLGEGGVVGDAVAAGGWEDVGGEVGEDAVGVGVEDDAVVGEEAAVFEGDGGAGGWPEVAQPAGAGKVQVERSTWGVAKGIFGMRNAECGVGSGEWVRVEKGEASVGRRMEREGGIVKGESGGWGEARKHRRDACAPFGVAGEGWRVDSAIHRRDACAPFGVAGEGWRVDSAIHRRDACAPFRVGC